MGSNGVYRGLVETQNVRMKTNESDPLESMDDLEEMQGTVDHRRYQRNTRLCSHSIP